MILELMTKMRNTLDKWIQGYETREMRAGEAVEPQVYEVKEKKRNVPSGRRKKTPGRKKH